MCFHQSPPPYLTHHHLAVPPQGKASFSKLWCFHRGFNQSFGTDLEIQDPLHLARMQACGPCELMIYERSAKFASFPSHISHTSGKKGALGVFHSTPITASQSIHLSHYMYLTTPDYT